MAETKKKKAQPVAGSPSSIGESSTSRIETSEPAGEPDAPERRPSRDDIERRAYEIYLARGDSAGSAEDDWHQAERELGQAGEEGEAIPE